MKLLNASYFRYLSHAVKHTKAAESILQDLKQRDDLLTKHQPMIDQLYEMIKEAAAEGKVKVEIPYSHPFWTQRDMHHIFRDKGFQVHYETNSIDWWWDTKENQLR